MFDLKSPRLQEALKDAGLSSETLVVADGPDFYEVLAAASKASYKAGEMMMRDAADTWARSLIGDLPEALERLNAAWARLAARWIGEAQPASPDAFRWVDLPRRAEAAGIPMPSELLPTIKLP